MQRLQPGCCAGHALRALGAGHLPQCERPCQSLQSSVYPTAVLCMHDRICATLCGRKAMHWVHLGICLSQAEVEVVTAGSPRVFNPAAAQWYDANVLQNFRFVNNKDVVPSLPYANSGYAFSPAIEHAPSSSPVSMYAWHDHGFTSPCMVSG